MSGLNLDPDNDDRASRMLLSQHESFELVPAEKMKGMSWSSLVGIKIQARLATFFHPSEYRATFVELFNKKLLSEYLRSPGEAKVASSLKGSHIKWLREAHYGVFCLLFPEKVVAQPKIPFLLKVKAFFGTLFSSTKYEDRLQELFQGTVKPQVADKNATKRAALTQDHAVEYQSVESSAPHVRRKSKRAEDIFARAERFKYDAPQTPPPPGEVPGAEPSLTEDAMQTPAALATPSEKRWLRRDADLFADVDSSKNDLFNDQPPPTEKATQTPSAPPPSPSEKSSWDNSL
jgi:hypothetical protein